MTDLICLNSLVLSSTDLNMMSLHAFFSSDLVWEGLMECVSLKDSHPVLSVMLRQRPIKINVINISVPSVESTVIKWDQTQHGSANQYSCFHEYLDLFLEIFCFLTSDYLSERKSQKVTFPNS